ncbi:MAG: glycosyltransferase [Cytophagaceae bacterium]|nr:glycosyltransferase [Cytophagaceae bacterium]
MKEKINTDAVLMEIAWEVCNQVGGIYTVIRSKVPSIMEKWGSNYCLIGPYFASRASAEFEEIFDYADDDPIAQAAKRLKDMGFEVHYGYWLVSGRPKVILLNPFSAYSRLGDVKYMLWEHHGISTPGEDDLLNQVVAFGFLVKEFLHQLSKTEVATRPVIAHFHEWMVGTAIPEIRRDNLNVNVVFTTHATLLGRYLAMNDNFFYDHLPFFDWEKEAKNFNIEAQVKIERAAAHGAHVFTTVSEVTARECLALLGRNPDMVLPNGLNIERFTALHESQNLHGIYKEQIHEFIMGHFFHSYPFDLDKTIYFFTSGRYEYKNKGFDLTLEALARLNWRMREEKMDTTVVMFFITKQPFHSINPSVLQSRAVMEEIRQTCEAIERQVGDRLFNAAAATTDTNFPNINTFVDDYWKLRLRRTLLSWKSKQLPLVVTHNMVNPNDEILSFVRTSNLVNNWWDRVKIVYHPDFISPGNPLFGMEYGQFVRGCHLGVFPSYYEPWGYTPLECMASGVPAVTSDLSGFGDYALENVPDQGDKGIYVVNRRYKSFDESANQLADQMMSFVRLTRRDRIEQRNRVERASEHFDWQNLSSYYDKAYNLVLKKIGKAV